MGKEEKEEGGERRQQRQTERERDRERERELDTPRAPSKLIKVWKPAPFI